MSTGRNPARDIQEGAHRVSEKAEEVGHNVKRAMGSGNIVSDKAQEGQHKTTNRANEGLNRAEDAVKGRNL